MRCNVAKSQLSPDELEISASKASRPRYYLTDRELSSTKYQLARVYARYFSLVSLCDNDSIHQLIRYKWRRFR